MGSAVAGSDPGSGSDAGASTASDAAAPSGGADAGGATLTDPVPGEYAMREALLEANSEMAVAEVNGKIYVLGGYPSSREVQTTVQTQERRTTPVTKSTGLPSKRRMWIPTMRLPID